MKREDDEQLWDLLGQTKSPEVSPFFARDVLRRVRLEPHWKIALPSWVSVRVLAPATAGVAAVAVAAIMLTHQQPAAPEQTASVEADPLAHIDPQDYEVVADLDVLLASEENNLWDDNSL